MIEQDTLDFYGKYIDIVCRTIMVSFVSLISAPIALVLSLLVLAVLLLFMPLMVFFWSKSEETKNVKALKELTIVKEDHQLRQDEYIKRRFGEVK